MIVGGLLSKLCLTLVTPWAIACQVPLSVGFSQARMLEWIGISFIQRTFLTQGLNLDLLHCRQILYHRATKEALIGGGWGCNSEMESHDPSPDQTPEGR